jgi:chaperonin GroES
MAKKESKSSIGVRPLADRVLVRNLLSNEKEKKTDSGIIIPETVKKDTSGSKRGIVIAVGEGRFDDGERVPMSVKEGDEVLFSWGDELEVDGEEYWIVNESNILAVIK